MEDLKTQPEETVREPEIKFLDKIKIHKWKILGGVLGVFVFAGGVFGAYKLGQRQVYPEFVEGPTPTPVATPTPDATADWRTYTNPVGKYSLKIPQIYNIKEMEGGGFSSGMDEVWFGTNPEAAGKIFFIAVYDSSDPKRFEAETNFPEAEITEIIVDNVYGKKQMRDDRFKFSGGKHTQQLFFEHKNRVILIYFSAESQSQIELFDQVFSTFLFLD